MSGWKIYGIWTSSNKQKIVLKTKLDHPERVAMFFKISGSTSSPKRKRQRIPSVT